MKKDWMLMFHNLLVETLREDAVFDLIISYEKWLKTEIGLTDEMIIELKENNLYVRPYLVSDLSA